MEARFEKEFASLWNRGRPAWGEAREKGLVWYEHTEGTEGTQERRWSRIDGLILAACLVIGDQEADPDGSMQPIDDGSELEWGAPLPLRYCVSRFKVIRCPFRLTMEIGAAVRNCAWKDAAEARAWVDSMIPLGCA